jgi:hypothetical protein
VIPKQWSSAERFLRARRCLQELPPGCVVEWFSQDDLDAHPNVGFVEVRCPAVEEAIAWSPAWTVLCARSKTITADPSPMVIVDEREGWSYPLVQELLEHWVVSNTGRRDVVLRQVATPPDVDLPMSWRDFDAEDGPGR